MDPRSTEAQLALERYFGELQDRFTTGFDPAAGGGGAETGAMRWPAGAFLVVRIDHTIVGCGGVQRVDDRVAEIKRMWIDPDWRGAGLGRRLLDRLESVARELGREHVVLDTNETLTEAIAMYEAVGYHRIDRYNDNPYAHHWFAKDLSRSASPGALHGQVSGWTSSQKPDQDDADGVAGIISGGSTETRAAT